MIGCKPGDVSINANHKIGLFKKGKAVERDCTKIGELIYFSHTKPDMVFSISCEPLYALIEWRTHGGNIQDPKILKEDTKERIAFPKKGTITYRSLHGCANRVGSISDRRSTSSFCTFVRGNLVSWRSKKQAIIARSRAEAGFRVVAHGVRNLLWLKKLLEKLKIKTKTLMTPYCGNKMTINIVHNLVQRDKTKHIEIDWHFIEEKLENGLICKPFIPTKE